MTAMEAWQHIYSNVEAKQSPQGRGGFQTLFYTQDTLTEAELDELEARMLYFFDDTEPVKHVFFTLSTGKRAVSQIVPLDETDQYGRKGRYIAHSLLFSANLFSTLNENPFPILQQAPFITNVQDALEQGDFESGNIDKLSINIQYRIGRTADIAASWEKAQYKRLMLIGLRGTQMARDRRAAAFFGPPEAIEAALEAAFLGVPTLMRPSCSFDTYFHRCNLVATHYWAVGFPDRTSNPTFDHVDAAEKRVLTMADDAAQTAYERWALHMVDVGNLKGIAMLRDTAYPLCLWLDSGATENAYLNGLDTDIVKPVFQASEPYIRKLLRQKIGQHIPTVLVEVVMSHIYDAVDHLKHFRYLQAGFTPDKLVDLLFQSYTVQRLRQPSRTELGALDTVLKDTTTHLMHAVHAAWGSRRKTMRKVLHDLNEAQYRQFVSLALDYELTDARNLPVSHRGDIFLDAYLGSAAAQSLPVLGVVEALIETDQPETLSRLTDLVSNQSPNTLRKLAKITRKAKNIPANFQKAIADTLAKLPAESSFARLTRSITNPFGLFERD